MKSRHLYVLGLALLMAFATIARAERQYILRTVPGSASAAASRHGLRIIRQLDIKGATLALAADTTTRPPDQVVTELTSDSSVQNAELNGAAVIPELNQSTVGILDGITDVTSTTYFGTSAWSQYVSQPAARIINMTSAQQSYASGGGVVAVIDTGVDPNHPVLSGSLLPGYNFVNNTPGGSELPDVSASVASALAASSVSLTNKQPVQVNQSTVAILDQSTVGILDGSVPPAFGHGTMVAGLVHLVAPTAKIMPLKAFTPDGSGTVFNIVSAIYYAVHQGANTINMSFSMAQASSELSSAISYANSARVVCSASVGNSGASVLMYPAAWKKVIGTASTTNNDTRSSFSNYGSAVKVAAPGEALFTTYPGKNYAAVWGTSFSTALVSGGAAMLRQIDGNINQDQATTALQQGVFVGADLGAGRIDLFHACQYWTSQKGR